MGTNIAIYMSFIFLISELILTFSRKAGMKSVVKTGDKGSLMIIWITITLCMIFGFNLANYNKWTLLSYLTGSVGLILFIAGIVIRWSSILQLRYAFNVSVVIKTDQKLKTDGLYKIVRHPSYLGELVIITGLALCMNSIVSFFIVIVPISIVFLYRINVEEKMLIEAFGDEYLKYSQTTKKLIPFIY